MASLSLSLLVDVGSDGEEGGGEELNSGDCQVWIQ